MDNESFLMGIIGGVAFIPMMALYLKLASMYPGLNLFQMAEKALGRAFGKLAGMAYLLFFFSLASRNLMEIGNFVSEFYLLGTPFLVVVSISSLAAAYALHKGAFSLARIMPLILAVAIFTLTMSIIQSFDKMDMMNLLPIFRHEFPQYAKSAALSVSIPYGEVLTMFSLLPLVRPGVIEGDQSKAAWYRAVRKAIICTAIFTCLMMTLVHLRDTAILGAMLTYVTLPSVEIYRMLDSFSSIARSESLHATILLLLALIKTVFTIYAAVQGVVSLLNLEDEKPIILPVAMLVSVNAAMFRLSSYNNMIFTINVTPLVWLTFEIVPALMIIIFGSVRRAKPERSRVRISSMPEKEM
jgi:spore germination protein (amino acid permease)